MIKLVNPNAELEVISEFDSSLIDETPEELQELIKNKGKTRYELYTENFDTSVLKFKEGDKPTIFVIRPLVNRDLIELQEKHFVAAMPNVPPQMKNQNAYFLDVFNKVIVGIKNEDGSIQKINDSNVGMMIAVGIGALAVLKANLGDNLKND